MKEKSVMMVNEEIVREKMREEKDLMKEVVFEIEREYRSIVKEMKEKKMRRCEKRIEKWIVKE